MSAYTSLQDEEALIGVAKDKHKAKIREDDGKFDLKLVAFVSIGILSFLYVLGELSAAIYLDSLVLLSDGFHNLSDVVSLGIAYWAQKAQKRDQSHEMSYGWARTEILGGLTNGCFLLSLCLYVALECIPKFIDPKPIESGLLFMITAAVGLAVNTIGTIVFCITGQGHSHSHGHGHGHSHGHKEKKKGGHEHKEGHSHSHGHGHKEEKHVEELDITEVTIKEKKKKDKEGHGHSHSHKEGHKHGHKDKKKKSKKDMNVHAVFLHFLGDAISSVMVLIAGALIHFFKGKWILYIDPVSSLLIVGIILYTTIPLVKRCSVILLQSTPNDVDVHSLRERLLKTEGIVSIHDFHIWQLIDGMIISSLHVGVEEGADFTHIIDEMKRILHEYGIHSTSIQPEFVPRNKPLEFCEQNCVRECDEDWCCKKPAEKRKRLLDEYSTATEL